VADTQVLAGTPVVVEVNALAVPAGWLELDGLGIEAAKTRSTGDHALT